MVELMKTTFMPLSREKIAREQLSRAKQRDGESVTDYTSRMRGLYLAIPNIAEGEKLDRYVRGLLPYFREKVFTEEPASFEDAVKKAAKYYALKFGFKNNNTGETSRGIQYGSGDMEVDAIRMHKPDNRSGNARYQNNRSSDVRYHGNSSGNFRYQNNRGQNGKPPPKAENDRKLCYHCDSPNHLKRDCPHLKNNSDKGKGNRRPAPFRRR